MKRNGLLQAQRHVFESGLSNIDKLVLLAVLDRWSRKSPQPFPTVKQLAQATSLNSRSVIRAVENLRRRGALRVIRTGRNNAYDLTAAFRGELPTIGDTESPVGSPDRCHRVTDPVARSADRSVTLTTEIGDTESLRLVTQSHPKGSSKEPKKEPRERERARTPKRAAPIPSSWEPSAEHRAFAAKHALDLDLEVFKFRGRYDGEAVKSPNGRFATWLGTALTFKRRDDARDAARGNAPRRMGPARAKTADNFDVSGDDFGDIP